MIRVNQHGVVERMIEEDGKLHVIRSQDVQALLEQNHHLAQTAPSMHGQAAWRLAARIPAVTAEQWSRECGAAIGTKEFVAYCKRKLQDSDFARFRIRGF